MLLSIGLGLWHCGAHRCALPSIAVGALRVFLGAVQLGGVW
jgi:hypothetical protein